MSFDSSEIIESPEGGWPPSPYSFARSSYVRHLALSRVIVLDAGHLGDRVCLEDVLTVPVRDGHESFIEASPINGFSVDEIERWVDGETVVPIVDAPECRQSYRHPKTMQRIVRALEAQGFNVTLPEVATAYRTRTSIARFGSANAR